MLIANLPCFEAKRKADAVFGDLEAAYDIVWQRGLSCKLLRFLRDKRVIQTIMELVQNKSFTVTTGSGKQSRLQLLKNGVHAEIRGLALI